MNISAVIPAYNAEHYIEKAVLSIVNQTDPVHEIIIVDDGSNDRTVDIVNRLQQQYKYIQLFQQTNAGASAARNNGISKASGNWILLLDADDECDADLIRKYNEKINEEKYAAIYSGFVQINETGEQISDTISGYELLGEEGFCQMFLRNPIISPSSSVIKKSVFYQLEGFDTTIKYVEDVDYWLRILLNGMNIGYISQPLSFIRRHLNNTTANINSTREGEKRLLNKFGLPALQKAVYARKYAVEDNHLDYISFLMRYEKWQEAKQLLATLNIESSHSRYVSYLFTKALVALHFEEYLVAQEIYLSVITRDATHGAALNNIGVLYAMNGQLEDARELLQQAFQHFPEYMDAKHNIEQLDVENPIYRFTKRELRKNLLRYS
ncbi:glycosyltransferase family 2 protein [Paenibacillus endoradicis]|uniref:glycosyltransferase family 2 protein n=1 Tax=Paenibacillus endoradicis TaxID=2972487 RepID=UPI002158B37A|nr:glycosyltransferase [Paenibacillus endoradicis]MCR8660523.1 glycosyltransferase [Paenibacillus endoradicis]